MNKSLIIAAVAGAVLVPATSGAFLLEQNAIAFDSGRTIGLDQLWRVYTAFDVTGPGWEITTIGIDGWEVIGGNSGNFEGNVFADDGTGMAADESVSLGAGVHDFNGPSGQSNWTDTAYNIPLAPGRYWFRAATDDPTHWSAQYLSDTGLNTYSMNSAGERFEAGPTAIRIDGAEVPEPATILAIGIGLAAIAARRRK